MTAAPDHGTADRVDLTTTAGKLADFEQLAAQQHVPHALLRRLGSSPLGGKFPLVGLLASVQDSLRAKAIELRQRIEESGA